MDIQLDEDDKAAGAGAPLQRIEFEVKGATVVENTRDLPRKHRMAQLLLRLQNFIPISTDWVKVTATLWRTYPTKQQPHHGRGCA